MISRGRGGRAGGSAVARAWRVAVLTGSVAAAAGAVHAAVNGRLLRRPVADPPGCRAAVSVLLPVRDEAHRLEPCLRSLLGQVGLARMELLVLDDGSTDGTAALARRIIAGSPRARLLTGRPPPAGWLGKPHACQQLADAAAADGDVLLFVDADVVLAPHAVAATVDLLHRHRLDLVSPYPRQRAGTVPERLVQPLLQWSWLTFLPLRLAEVAARPSLATANGQLLAVRRAAYEAAGGHAAVRAEVLDDVALARAVRRAGGRGGMADGTALATCRMYRGWAELRDGYTKSLWSAFGSRAGATAALAVLAVIYIVPAVAAATGSAVGLAGYAAGVTSRALTARRTGGRPWPDALAHPASVAALGWLTVRSHRARTAGTLRWKGRPLAPAGPAAGAAR
ncbi:MAG: hypothetical protein V7637_800 [Mycobacteriales bacterium]|jgi:hypothetical protein